MFIGRREEAESTIEKAIFQEDTVTFFKGSGFNTLVLEQIAFSEHHTLAAFVLHLCLGFRQSPCQVEVLARVSISIIITGRAFVNPFFHTDFINFPAQVMASPSGWWYYVCQHRQTRSIRDDND